MLIEVHRKTQQIPVIRTGVAAGYRWSVEFYSPQDSTNIEIRVFAPKLVRWQTAKYEYPLNSVSSQWDIPAVVSARSMRRVNPVYVLSDDVKESRTPA